MSIIKSIKQQLGLGGTASEQHFWDGSVANQLTLKRGTPDAPGTELLKFLNGIASFPNQGQSLAQNGYVKFPGGVMVAWGLIPWSSSNPYHTFPTAFPNECRAVVGMLNGVNTINLGVLNLSKAGFTANSNASEFYGYYIAIGH